MHEKAKELNQKIINLKMLLAFMILTIIHGHMI